MNRLHLLIFIILLAACTGGSPAAAPPEADATETVTAASPTTSNVPDTTNPTSPTSSPPRSPLADAVRPLDSAIYEPPVELPPPVTLTIDRLGVDSSPIVAVGVEDNGDMEIPGAREVGWYRYGPRPGEQGSAVLAAHIAYNGVDGVFRYLTRLDVGDTFEVGYADGTTTEFVVTELAQYDKDELPKGRVFARSGEPEIALITCGGDFNRALRSYEDNVVAYAVPVAPAE